MSKKSRFMEKARRYIITSGIWTQQYEGRNNEWKFAMYGRNNDSRIYIYSHLTQFLLLLIKTASIIKQFLTIFNI